MATTLTVEQSVGRAFSDIPAVERVHVFQCGELLNVFTIVEDDDESAFDLIYDRELDNQTVPGFPF